MLNLIQLTPGAGAMYCGNCLRDNALVGGLRRLGHSVLMVPLYLPLTLDQEDQSAGTPLFFNGIRVYLEQKSSLFRHAPGWLHRLLNSSQLLQWAARLSTTTQPAQLGELTLSMLRGESGRQARELDQLLDWLKTQPKPDAVCLSNVLLLGLARRLRRELAAPVVCSLQGEEAFLEALPGPQRTQCWKELAERAAEVDLFLAPSRYFAERMGARMGVPPARIRVLYNGIQLDSFLQPRSQPEVPGAPPVIGFFARMCPEKGLDLLVEAFIQIVQRGRIPGIKLRLGGYCGPAEAKFVAAQRQRLETVGLLGSVEFQPNLSHQEKAAFLQSLTVFSVPALYGEAFGLYLLEAWAAGVPVLQPRSGAFPELVAATGGGLLCEPGPPQALAEALERLLLAPQQARVLGASGQRTVREQFSSEIMAKGFAEAMESLTRPPRQR